MSVYLVRKPISTLLLFGVLGRILHTQITHSFPFLHGVPLSDFKGVLYAQISDIRPPTNYTEPLWRWTNKKKIDRILRAECAFLLILPRVWTSCANSPVHRVFHFVIYPTLITWDASVFSVSFMHNVKTISATGQKNRWHESFVTGFCKCMSNHVWMRW